MIFRPARDREGNDRFFALKAALLVAGASLGGVGMVAENRTLVYIAMVIIAIGILLRFVRVKS